MQSKGEFLFGDGAVAGFDQVKAAALDKMRGCDAFILVTGSWEGAEDMSITTAAGVNEMDAVVFLALSTAEVAKTMKNAVIAATEELDEVDS